MLLGTVMTVLILGMVCYYFGYRSGTKKAGKLYELLSGKVVQGKPQRLDHVYDSDKRIRREIIEACGFVLVRSSSNHCCDDCELRNDKMCICECLRRHACTCDDSVSRHWHRKEHVEICVAERERQKQGGKSCNTY